MAIEPCLRRKVETVSVAGSIARLKVAVMGRFTANAAPAFAGTVDETVGALPDPPGGVLWLSPQATRIKKGTTILRQRMGVSGQLRELFEGPKGIHTQEERVWLQSVARRPRNSSAGGR